MPSYPNNGLGLTNAELIEYLELPTDTISKLQTAQGSDYQAIANQFLEALHNKVLYQTVASMNFSNPFKQFDSFPINYGDTIENIFVEMPKGYAFNKDATDPFTKVVPSVKALYASINYELQYATTVEDALLRRACLSEYGFMGLIDSVLAQLAKSMSLDEYFATIAMLNNKDIYANGFETLSVSGDDSAVAKAVTQKIVDTVSSFKLPMTSNNKLGVMQVSNPSDVLLIIKYGLLNSINLDYLAGVYNLSKVDLVKRIIEVDGFKVANAEGTLVGEDLDFIILDTKGFDMHTALQDGGMIYNPKGKYTNHFYNLWKIMSYKYFFNARAFKISKTA